MTRLRVLAIAGVTALPLTTGCHSNSASSGGAITVFAAASLQSAFTEIANQHKTDNPGSSVEFSFAGFSDLVTQLTEGATADVFASADTRNMDNAAQAGLLDGNPVNFATNTLTIAVAPGNPRDIKSFQDLTKPGVNVVVCAPSVPCGGATQQVEKATGVTLAPISEESSVTNVLNKASRE